MTASYWLATAVSGRLAPDEPPVRAVPPPSTQADEVEVAVTPQAAAVAWLHATTTLSWHDPGPSAWVERAEPLLTGAALQEARALRDGRHGEDWDRMITDRCTQHVQQVGSVIPPEAPQSADTVYVQVAGTLVTDCVTGADIAPQPMAATVKAARSDGSWLISDQLY